MRTPAEVLAPFMNASYQIREQTAHQAIALEAASISIKDLFVRLAGTQFLVGLIFCMGTWTVWNEDPQSLKWVCLATGLLAFGAGIYNYRKSRPRWDYLLLISAISELDKGKLNEELAPKAGVPTATVDQKADL